jgi:hypothetical protein
MNKPLLDLEKLKSQFDKAETYEDYNGNKLKTIYLGDIRDITPSGKIYTPFAYSNLTICKCCKGDGSIKNKNAKIKKYASARKHFKTLIESEKRNYKKINKYRKQLEQWKPSKTCPECSGLGSIEARLDEDFWEELQSELDEINAWHHGSEGDGCDVMVSIGVD